MPEPQSFPKVGHFKSLAEFQAHLASLNLELPCDDRVLSSAEGSPLADPIDFDGFTIGNRWTIHPMEGWDGTTDGRPTGHTVRRWEHFGASGAKLIWGGEALAVQPDGRANPNQLCHFNDAQTEQTLRALLDSLLKAHRSAVGTTDDLLVGLQLTHSGRFCRPHSKKLEPRIAYHHPLLDAKFGISPADDSVLLTDDDLERLIDNYLAVARIAARVGFHFVDVKHCHGYLGHELLSAYTRPGKFGGPLENRTRFLRTITERIRSERPWLAVGVRFSAFDLPPFKPDPSRSKPGQLGPGIPENFRAHLPYEFAFGCNRADPLEPDLSEPITFAKMLRTLGVKLLNISAGSPYYNPHIQRPAIFPPSDGYQPPEDPLVGVARQVHATRAIKQACPDSIIVGTGYSYLQEYLPHVAQAIVRQGWADSIGVGRLVLSYWELPLDTLAGRPLQDKRICRTFSDCTTAPRNGIISGCFPLDPHYKDAPEAAQLKLKKQEIRKALTVVSS